MNNQKDDIFALILESQKADRAFVKGAVETRDTFPSDWSGTQEGRLAVDIYDTKNAIVVLAPMAGAEPGSVEVFLHNDMLSIRGTRVHPEDTEDVLKSYHGECYWGPFSRSVILPVDIAGGAAEASFRHGLLTVRIPKVKKHKGRAIPIEIVEE